MLSLRSLTPVGSSAAIVAVLLIVTLAWWAATGSGRERARADLAIERANGVARDTDLRAREAAADKRLTDAAINAVRQKDLAHAIEALPDAQPSDRRRALACARLRQQGTNTAALSACRGYEG